MQNLFPTAPNLPAALNRAVPVREWVMPAKDLSRRHGVGFCTRLPPGMPDCLQVETFVGTDAVERSTAAVYGNRSYLIHYEFKRR